MAKYKICPCCGAHNSTAAFECSSCETDLTGVRATDEKTESEVTPTQSALPSLMRICDCGAENPANARKCIKCGEDISDIIPTMPGSSSKSSQPSQFVLAAIDGEYAFEVAETVTVIGREQAMKEYLSSKSFVSRTHAKLTVTKGELYITNLSGTNFTYVNNEKIGSDPTRISDGDEIGLGGCVINGCRQTDAAYFIVRVGSCI